VYLIINILFETEEFESKKQIKKCFIPFYWWIINTSKNLKTLKEIIYHVIWGYNKRK
jgi:hypothetical protein